MGDICPTFLDGDWIESKDQSDSGVRLIQTGNIGVGAYIEKEDRAKWVSEDTFNRLHCEEVFAGDILISRLPESAGRACIVPDFDIAENRLDVVLILPPIGVDSALFQLLGSVVCEIPVGKL